MRCGFRSFSEDYRVVVFLNDPELKLPEYAKIRDEHQEFRTDIVRQYEVSIPHDRGLDFWKWCQGEENVSIKLDTQGEFHCPSCLRRTEQSAWSPRRSPAKNLYEVTARCKHCGAFYLVVWATTKKATSKIKESRRYR